MKPKNKWISVEDKLPEKGIKVFVYYGDETMGFTSLGSGMYDETFTRDDGEIFLIWDNNTIGVTHWMYPKPPKFI